MRLHKFLADCGVASRRGAEALIAAGCVSVNGVSISQQGVQIDPHNDLVCVEGRRVSPPARHVYFMLHKPRGYLTTVKDPKRRKTVLDLMKKVHERIFPVGRLDLASEGLLLLTTDGDLANHLMHPRYHLEKEYHVSVDRCPTENEIARLSDGLRIGTKRAKASKVDILSRPAGKERAKLRVILTEGKKRQIRRMFEALGISVHQLKRVRQGPIELGKLPLGKNRSLTSEEVKQLFKAVGLETSRIPG